MRIHRIRLKNYRGVLEADHHFTPDGVTVVEGPNETGKSSIPEALRLALKYKDRTTDAAVRDVRPEGRDVGTLVEVDLESGPYRFTLQRRWFQDKGTELRVLAPSAEALVGDEAHNRLQQILDETLDKGLWEALTVIQGNGIDPAPLPLGSSLTQALDQAAGGTRAGERELDLFGAVEMEHNKHFTANGKPKGDLKEAPDQVQRLEEEARLAQLRVEAADVDAAEAARLTGLADQKVRLLMELKARRTDLEARMTEADRLRGDAEKRLAELEKCREAAQRISDRIEGRTLLVREVDDARKGVKGLDEARQEVERSLGELAKAAQADEEAATEAEALATAASHEVTIASDDLVLLHTDFDRTLLAERRELITDSERQVGNAQETLGKNAVDTNAMQQVRKAAERLQTAQDRLTEASPTLRLHPAIDVKVKLGRTSVQLEKGGEKDVPVTENLSLHIPDFGRVEVRPGSTLDELQERAEKANLGLVESLRACGAKGEEQALHLHEEWKEATAILVAHEKTVQHALRSNKVLAFTNIQEMAAKLQELGQRVESIRRLRPKGRPMPPTKEEASRLESAAREQVIQMEREAKTLRGKANAAARKRDAEKMKLIGLEGELRQATVASKRAESRMTEEQAAASDQDLASRLEQAKKLQDTAQALVSEAGKRLAAEDPDGLETRLESAQKAIERADGELERIKEDLARTNERLRLAADSGVGELNDGARDRLERARRDHGSLVRRAEAAKILYEVMGKHRDAAHRRYARPLADKIQTLARLVIGFDTEVRLDEDLSIKEVVRGGIPLKFAKLSGGTREQLGIIQRLACAMVVSRDGDGVPVIIDDALGYSDPDRIDSMAAVIDRAGKECQVIVLSCVPDRYARVGTAKTLTTRRTPIPMVSSLT